MKATNIEWNISDEELLERLDDMLAETAAEKLGVPVNSYANMTTEERHDYALDSFHHHKADKAEFIGLPNEVELPEEAKEWSDDEITDYLSDEYGYYLDRYDLPERDDLEK